MRLDGQVIGRQACKRRIVHFNRCNQIVRCTQHAIQCKTGKRDGKLGTAVATWLNVGMRAASEERLPMRHSLRSPISRVGSVSASCRAVRMLSACCSRERFKRPRCAAITRRGPAGNCRSATRAARLDAWKLELLHIAHYAFAEQKHVAMPAMPLWHCCGDGDWDEPVTAFKQAEIEQAGTLAETPVGFLQGDYIRVDFADDFGRTLRIELLVDADAFVDIVRCNDDITAGDIGVERPEARPVPDRSQDGLRYPVWFFLFSTRFSPVRYSVPKDYSIRQRDKLSSLNIVGLYICLNSNSLHNWANSGAHLIRKV